MPGGRTPVGARKTVYIRTFGCQMNKLDSELVLGMLIRDGYGVAPGPEEADLILFNTCSVRKHAEDKVYSHLGRLKFRKRRNPDLIIGVVGCMAQREKERIFRRAPHVDLVCGPRDFGDLPSLVRSIREGRHGLIAADLAR